MKKKYRIIVITLVICGLGLIIYPTLSDLISRYTQNITIIQYKADMANADTDTEMSKAKEYNQKLADEESPDNYDECLKNTGGVMAAVTIPKIDVTLPVYHTSDDDSLTKGAAHMYGTSLPTGGNNTNCVIAGHRGLPDAKLFTDLDKMAAGDVFYITVLNETHTYKVIQTVVTEPDDEKYLLIQRGKDLVTLYTCTPIGINSQRLLVIGERMQDQTGEVPEITEKASLPLTAVLITGVAVIGITMIILILVRCKRRRTQ